MIRNASKLAIYIVFIYITLYASYVNTNLAGLVSYSPITILAEVDFEERQSKRIESLKKDYTWHTVKCEVTAYTLNECGKDLQHPDYGITAFGYTVLEGRTIAASPELASLTLVMVPGLSNIFRVEDRGGSIQTHKGTWPGATKIDIYTTDIEWAKEWGRKLMYCKILNAPLTLDT